MTINNCTNQPPKDHEANQSGKYGQQNSKLSKMMILRPGFLQNFGIFPNFKIDDFATRIFPAFQN